MAAIIPDRPTPRAIETAQAQEARRIAVKNMLKMYGPNAVNEYVMRPTSAYYETLNKPTLNEFFKETSERIPKGTEMYRAPSRGEVLERLPREVGATYRPGIVTSTAASSDLQALGELIAGKRLGTGGAQSYAPGMAKITAMTDLPGIYDTDEFLKRSGYSTKTGWNLESILGPKTKYVVQGYEPPQGGNPAFWRLGAYANMGLGAANILGLLPALAEGGNIMTGRSNQFRNVGGIN